jgi:FMN-dependent NADH-azoreductase
MATLLYVEGSPRKERSYSIRVAKAFLEAYRASHPADTVKTVDVWGRSLPEFGGLEVAAKYKLMHGKPYTPEEEKAWKAVVAAIGEFKTGDKVVISSPMWNFGIPYMLKRYIDILLQPSLAFSVSPQGEYKGLITGRPAMLILSRGGSYGPGNPSETYDFQRTYLELALRFIGFEQIDAILCEPTLNAGPEAAEKALAAATAMAKEKAKSF